MTGWQVKPGRVLGSSLDGRLTEAFLRLFLHLPFPCLNPILLSTGNIHACPFF